ncbi:RHS repeat-associated core domain-containing protein [Patescibacteria group bacterium]|nr:MAG: RHS repeat-associated core domain-containing protein [Patescibacteria group bacterium]
MGLWGQALFMTNYSSTRDHHVYANNTLLASVRGTNTGTSTYYVHTDHLQGSTVITDASSTVSELIDYFPFGELRTDQKQTTYNESRKYIGQEYDTETALSYLNARYYDGRIGRFVSQDPSFLAIGYSQGLKKLTGQDQSFFLSNPQTLNSYAYADNNPIVNKDPNGLCPACILALIGGTVAFYSTWYSDIRENQAASVVGWQQFAPRSSFSEYVTSVSFGAASAVQIGTKAVTSGVIAAAGSVIQDYAGGRPIDPIKAVLTGVSAGIGGKLFKSAAGQSPFDELAEEGLPNLFKKTSSSLLDKGARYAVGQEALQTLPGMGAQELRRSSGGSSRPAAQGSGQVNGRPFNMNQFISALRSLIASFNSKKP